MNREQPMEQNPMPDVPAAPCCQGPEWEAAGWCICSPSERAIRAWTDGAMPPMTADQRAWCIEELRAVEGWADHADSYLAANDAMLAQAVLRAWVDYCLDKGLM